jgi:hypothetical protein
VTTMDCKKYRQAIAADPSGSFASVTAHAAGCVPCRSFADGIRSLDTLIAEALAIDVPPLRMPALPPIGSNALSRVAELDARRRRKATLPKWVGLAAGLAAAWFLGTRFLAPDVATPSLARQVIAHMDHEQESRQVTSVAVSDQALEKVISSDVSTIGTGGGLVTYARSCVINGKAVPHLVIQGEDGPVTLILMSEEIVDAAIPLSGENVHGVIVPVGSGSVAIIGEQTEQLNEIDTIKRRLVESVKWRI